MVTVPDDRSSGEPSVFGAVSTPPAPFAKLPLPRPCVTWLAAAVAGAARVSATALPRSAWARAMRCRSPTPRRIAPTSTPTMMNAAMPRFFESRRALGRFEPGSVVPVGAASTMSGWSGGAASVAPAPGVVSVMGARAS